MARRRSPHRGGREQAHGVQAGARGPVGRRQGDVRLREHRGWSARAGGGGLEDDHGRQGRHGARAGAPGRVPPDRLQRTRSRPHRTSRGSVGGLGALDRDPAATRIRAPALRRPGLGSARAQQRGTVGDGTPGALQRVRVHPDRRTRHPGRAACAHRPGGVSRVPETSGVRRRRRAATGPGRRPPQPRRARRGGGGAARDALWRAGVRKRPATLRPDTRFPHRVRGLRG